MRRTPAERRSNETRSPKWNVRLNMSHKWVINNSSISTQYVNLASKINQIQRHLLLIHFQSFALRLSSSRRLCWSNNAGNVVKFRDTVAPRRENASKISAHKWTGKEKWIIIRRRRNSTGYRRSCVTTPLLHPPLPKPFKSRLPSSESICYQIKRRASDSLLFSAAADLYAECKTDALCDTYLWWAPLSQDLL